MDFLQKKNWISLAAYAILKKQKARRDEQRRMSKRKKSTERSNTEMWQQIIVGIILIIIGILLYVKFRKKFYRADIFLILFAAIGILMITFAIAAHLQI